MYVPICVYVCPMHTSARGGSWISYSWSCRPAWVLGGEVWSSAEAVSVPKRTAISQAVKLTSINEYELIRQEEEEDAN